MQAIKTLISEYVLEITAFAILTTCAIIIIAITNTKRKRRYMLWKKYVLNLGVFKGEWERNDDKFTEELFSENEKLLEENKALKSDVTKFVIIVFIIYLAHNLDKMLKYLKNRK